MNRVLDITVVDNTPETVRSITYLLDQGFGKGVKAYFNRHLKRCCVQSAARVIRVRSVPHLWPSFCLPHILSARSLRAAPGFPLFSLPITPRPNAAKMTPHIPLNQVIQISHPTQNRDRILADYKSLSFPILQNRPLSNDPYKIEGSPFSSLLALIGRAI